MAVTPYPQIISIQADIELSAKISSALLREFSEREEGFMNLRVGIDLPLFPNYFNLILLEDIAGVLPPILTQCDGVYIPEQENLAAGETPMCRLTRDIRELPEVLQNQLIASDPRILEPQETTGISLIDLTGVIA